MHPQTQHKAEEHEEHTHVNTHIKRKAPTKEGDDKQEEDCESPAKKSRASKGGQQKQAILQSKTGGEGRKTMSGFERFFLDTKDEIFATCKSESFGAIQ